MTNRDFYTAIVKGEMNDEIKAFAEASIAKLDNRNATRSSKPSKAQVENAPIKEAILNYLVENKGQYTETQLGEALEISHNKAGSLARQLVKEGKAMVSESKFPKVGKRKVYSIITD